MIETDNSYDKGNRSNGVFTICCNCDWSGRKYARLSARGWIVSSGYCPMHKARALREAAESAEAPAINFKAPFQIGRRPLIKR